MLSPIINSSYRHNVKYSDEDYIKGIIDVLQSSAIWNCYSGAMNGNILRKKHSKWVKIGIYDHAYESILKKYFNKTSISEERKYQSINSTFIEDINGCKMTAYN